MIIAIDFDGTCVKHEYPAIGEDIGAIPVLQKLVAAGHRLILYTMRCRGELSAAEDWFRVNKIDLWATNENPEQIKWTSSPKIFAHLYIDDAAAGCPLMNTPGDRPYINWRDMRRLLVFGGYL